MLSRVVGKEAEVMLAGLVCMMSGRNHVSWDGKRLDGEANPRSLEILGWLFNNCVEKLACLGVWVPK